MGWIHWWIHGGYGIERVPHQPLSSRLYGQNRGKANARIVERYVIVMTDEPCELIVIRADDNLDSRDQTDTRNDREIHRSSCSTHVSDMKLSVNTYILQKENSRKLCEKTISYNTCLYISDVYKISY